MHLTWSKHVVTLVHNMSLHFEYSNFFSKKECLLFKHVQSHCFIVTRLIEHSKPFFVVQCCVMTNGSKPKEMKKKPFHYFGIPRLAQVTNLLFQVLWTQIESL